MLASGKLIDANLRADQFLSVDPQDLQAHLAKAKISAVQRDLDAAHRWVDQAQSLGAPLAEVELIRANLFAQQGQLARAVSLYEAVISLDPSRAEAHFGLGLARVKAKDHPAGLQSLARAVELAPGNAAFHYRYGQALLEVGRFEEGKAQLQAALKLEHRFLPAHLALYQALMREQNLPMARVIVDRALGVLPDHPRLLAAMTNVQLLQGDVEGASRTAIVLAGQRPRDPEAQGNLALLLILRGKREEALHICRSQASQGLSNATLQMVEAMYFEGEQPPRLEEAIRAYETAMGLDPSDWRAANNLGQLLLRMDEGRPGSRQERALTVLEEAVRRAPTQLEPRLNLALILAQREDVEHARLVLAPVLAARLPERSPLREQAQRLEKVLSQPRQ
ncbi:MAG: tetratricopeptide repeat protein [Myxococcota bacterium]|nr:tetratricopeptide repeat protein [Myxococcota bacterium]